MKNALDMVKEAWKPFTQHLGLTLGVPAILTIVPSAVVGIPAYIVMVIMLGAEFYNSISHSSSQFGQITPSSQYIVKLIPLAILTCIAFAAVYNAFRVGWTRIMLKLARNESCSIGEMTQALAFYPKFLITLVLTGLATFIGALCFVIPGIYIGVRISLAPFLVVDENLGPIEAMMRSNQLVTGYAWQILLYMVLYCVANSIAGFIPFLGFLLMIPIMGLFDLALSHIYVMLKDGTSGSYMDD